MGFVYEEVGKENEELWNSIGWQTWEGMFEGYSDAVEWCIDKEKGVYLNAIGSY